MRLVDELLGLIDRAAAPLVERQAAEVVELDARIERFGERGSGKRMLEERHKRELRRHRTDEIRHGLSVLAGSYRDALFAGPTQRPDAIADAVARIHAAIETLERNPNEPLLLQSLLWSLPALPTLPNPADLSAPAEASLHLEQTERGSRAGR
jgi:DNA polymerase-3 subunit delta'